MNEYFSANVKPLAFKQRLHSYFDGPVDMEIQTERAAGSIALEVKKYFYEHLANTKVVATRTVPVYGRRTVYFPATAWDGVKRSADSALHRIQSKLRGIRASGRLYSRENNNAFENWLTNLRIPYNLTRSTESRKIREETIDTVIHHINICPHCDIKPGSFHHVVFLNSTDQTQVDRHTIISAARLFEELIREIPEYSRSYEQMCIVRRIKQLMKDYT